MSDEQVEEAAPADNAAGMSTFLIVLTTIMIAGALLILKDLTTKQYGI